MKTRLLLLLLFVSSLTFAQVPTGATKTYKFDNAAIGDLASAGSSRLGISDRNNEPNMALDLNGDVLWVTPNLNRDVSVSFWIKTSTVDSNIKTIIDLSKRDSDFDNASDIGFYAYLVNGNVGIASGFRVLSTTTGNVLYNSGYSYATSTTNIADGLWHHVAITRDDLENTPPSGSSSVRAVTIKVYVDGVLEGIDTDSRGTSSNSSMQTQLAGNFTIGNNEARNLSVNRKYTEDIDDIRLYAGTVLTDMEVVDLFLENDCAPLNLTATTTTNTANITWSTLSNQDNWDLSYDISPALEGSGTIVTNLTSPNYLINGLTANTDYDCYVRSTCSGVLSPWRKITFTTLPPALFVDVNANGANDGSSWLNALTNLKDALDNNPNREFWVADGTYSPGSSRGNSFNLGANQKIYGGFNGTETDLSQRNVIANPTILSGDINGDDASIFNPSDTNRSENNYRIINVNGDSVIIDGFVITSANANGSSASTQEGSGINISGPYNITINNCQFIKHTLSRAGVIRAIDNSGNYTITVNNSIFKDNQSIFATCFYGRSNNGTINLQFEGSLFTNNTATTNSGASLIWLRQDTSGSQNLDIVNSTFSNNTLNSGTPVITYLSNVPSVNIYNSIFWNNTNGSGTIVDALQSGASGVISNNLSNNGFTGYGSASNILTGDPLFVDAANEDFRLGSGSPAIDTGDNSFVTSTTDLSFNPRIFNTTVDMGAYEYNPSLSNDSFQTNNEFVIYPNPIENILNIKAASNITNVEIYTIQGVKVLESNLENIDVSTLSSGLYIINIQDENNRTTSKKFIKK